MAWPVATRSTGFLVTAAVWNADVVANLNHIINSSGNLVVAGTGPHAIGAGVNSAAMLRLAGAFSPTGAATGIGFEISPTLSPEANDSCFGMYVVPSIVEAGSGTHSFLATVGVLAPVITGGAAAVTNTTALYLEGVATAGANNYAVYIEGVGHDGHYLVLSDFSDVAHGMTVVAPTSAFLTIRKHDASNGGAAIQGLSDSTVGARLAGFVNTATTTKSSAAVGAVEIGAALRNGTGVQSLGANGNIAVFTDISGTKVIIDADGDIDLDGTANDGAFDDYHDAALLKGYRGLMRGDHTLAAFINYARPVLERAGIVTYNDDGHHFFSVKGLFGLTLDAICQQEVKIQALRAVLSEKQRARYVELVRRPLQLEAHG